MWKLKNAFRKHSVPPALIDLTAPAFFADPYPAYELLRPHHAIVAAANGGHVLLRHADILEALSDEKLGNAPSRYSALAAKKQGPSCRGRGRIPRSTLFGHARFENSAHQHVARFS